jgi:diguanylate cyclase (GGDEF)-like protein
MTRAMQDAPILEDEDRRLAALRDLEVLDAPAEPALEDLVSLCARLIGMPIAAVNFVDADRQWTAAAVGMAHGDQAPRRTSFCAHAIAGDGPLVVEDARADERFSDNPLTLDGLRFYAGIPLRSPEGLGLGTLCVADHEPRKVSADDLEALRVLAQAVNAHVRLRRDHRRLEQLATTDPLTGVANRRALDDWLPREVARASRTGAPLGLVLLDLDHFKAYNDTHGHTGGDALLRVVAGSWARALRQTDLLARFGGEEFVAVLPGADGPGAALTADRLRAAMPPGATCSAGVAAWRPGDDGHALLRRADEALYRAKAAGRDRVELA